MMLILAHERINYVVLFVTRIWNLNLWVQVLSLLLHDLGQILLELIHLLNWIEGTYLHLMPTRAFPTSLRMQNFVVCDLQHNCHLLFHIQRMRKHQQSSLSFSSLLSSFLAFLSPFFKSLELKYITEVNSKQKKKTQTVQSQRCLVKERAKIKIHSNSVFKEAENSKSLGQIVPSEEATF